MPRSGRPGLAPAGDSGRRRSRPHSAAVPPGGRGDPQGRGEPGCGAGRGRHGARRPEAYPAPPPRTPPRPAGRAARSARAPQDPVRPPARRFCPRAPPRPPGPLPRRPGAGPPHPFILRPGPGVGRRSPGLTYARSPPALPARPSPPPYGSPGMWAGPGAASAYLSAAFFFLLPPCSSAGLTDQSERRWQWTRKLGGAATAPHWAPARAFPCQARGI